MANHGRYTREQEAETVVKMLSTMPHQDPRKSDARGGWHRKAVVHDRVAELLDGLATICVSKPQQDPVAVGLQMQVVEKKLTFVIAVEKSLAKKTISHAKDVLKGLQELGHAYSKHRISVSAAEKKTSDLSSEESAKVNRDDLPPQLQEMELVWLAKIYRFCFAECKYRLQKPYKVFRKTMPQIDHFIKLIGLLLPKFMDDHDVITRFKELHPVMKVVKAVLDMPSDHPDYMSDESMGRLCEGLWYASYQVTKILTQPDWQDVLGSNLRLYGVLVQGKSYW